MAAAQFLRDLVEAVPYAIHTVLTDNGIQFTNQARHKYAFHHIFDRVCEEDGIEHRLTKLKHPWTNRSEEHTSELQSLMRISYAVFCLKKKKNILRKENTAPQ